MLCPMTSRRDHSPKNDAAKTRILALEAELAAALTQLRAAEATTATLAAERTARESLAREHAELQTKHATLQAQHDLLVAEHDRLKAFLKIHASEHRSEKRIFPDARQLKLLFDKSPELAAAREAALAEAAKLVDEHKARCAARQQAKRQFDKGLPAGLRRVVEVVAAPPEQLVCAKHGERKLLGYDKVETLVHKRPELYVLERQYPKHVCPGCAACGVATPPRPTGLVAGDRIDTSVGATVVTGKWWYHLPLYRLQDYFATMGWQASRSTLNNVVKSIDFVLQPLYDLQRRRVQADCIVSFDDTTCRMLVSNLNPEDSDEPLRDKLTKMQQRNTKSISANMWAYSGQCRAPYDVFDFQVWRGAAGPADFFKNTEGVAVGDCYSGNLSSINCRAGRLRLAACWAHVRRKLEQCATYQQQRDELLELINALYDIEAQCVRLEPERRQEIRNEQSRVLLAGIHARLHGAAYDDLLKSDYKTAVGYIHNHWAALNVYVDDGRVPIDNNLAERLMKRVAMGRKAWLFVNGLEGGRRSARLMSIVASAHRHDLDVEAYLKEVLDRLLAGSTDYESLLPDVWKQTHSTAVRTYREAERQQKAERKQVRAAQRRLARAS